MFSGQVRQGVGLVRSDQQAGSTAYKDRIGACFRAWFLSGYRTYMVESESEFRTIAVELHYDWICLFGLGKIIVIMRCWSAINLYLRLDIFPLVL